MITGQHGADVGYSRRVTKGDLLPLIVVSRANDIVSAQWLNGTLRRVGGNHVLESCSLLSLSVNVTLFFCTFPPLLQEFNLSEAPLFPPCDNWKAWRDYFLRCCLQLTPYRNFFTLRPCGGWVARLSLSPTRTSVSVIHKTLHIKKSLLRYLVFWEDWLIAFCTRNLSFSCFDSLLLILFWDLPPPLHAARKVLALTHSRMNGCYDGRW